LLRQRFLMQQGFRKAAMSTELRVMSLEVNLLRRENQLLRQQVPSTQSLPTPTHTV
jgi:hypothetical protein